MKYAYHMPLYRLVQMLASQGIFDTGILDGPRRLVVEAAP
jgi:hypothetical protein